MSNQLLKKAISKKIKKMSRPLDFMNHAGGGGGLSSMADIRSILAHSRENSDPTQNYGDNVKERLRTWINGCLQETLAQRNISRDLIQRNIVILYDALSLCFARWGLLDHVVGFVFSHSLFTEYSARNITLKVLYELDQTPAATISHISERRPENMSAVRYTNILRHFKFTKTLWQATALVDTEVFNDMLRALSLIVEQRFTAGMYRTYVGEHQNNPLDEPGSKESLMQMHRFFEHIKKRHSSAIKSQSASHTNAAVVEVVSMSPFACVLPRQLSVLNIRSNRDLYLNSLAQDEIMLFGLNKWDGNHPEMRNTLNSLEALMSTFETNTDNITTLKDNLPTVIIDGKEMQPKVIVWFMQQTMDFLLNKTRLIQTKQGKICQSMTKISLADDDYNPMNAMAKHDSVTRDGTSFLRDPNGGFSKDKNIVDCDIHTMYLKGKLAIACCLDRSVLTPETINQTGLRKISSFDMLMPQGTVMTDTGKGPAPGDSLLRPTTVSFMDHTGCTHTLPEPDWGSAKWRPFVEITFNPFHCLGGKDDKISDMQRGLRIFDESGSLMFRGVVHFDDNVYRSNEAYMQNDHHEIHNVGESFLFYSKHPHKQTDTDLNYYKSRLHAGNAIVLNQLVIDNHYFDMNLFINNVIRCLYNVDKYLELMTEYFTKITQYETDGDGKSSTVWKTDDSEMNKLDKRDLIASMTKRVIEIPTTQKTDEYKDQFGTTVNIPSRDQLFNSTKKGFAQQHQKRAAYANLEELANSIEGRVVAGLDALSMPLPTVNGRKVLDDATKKLFVSVCETLRCFPNAGFSIVPNLLNLINPGWSLNWLIEMLVEDEAVVLNRPASYMNVKTIPLTRRQEIRETDTIQYTMQQSLAIHKQSLNYGSVIDPHAYYARSVTRATAYHLAPEELLEYDWSKNYSILFNGYTGSDSDAVSDDRNTEQSPWIPLIAAPYQSSNWWCKQMSPVGRLAGHYESEEEFKTSFYNHGENDILHTGVYTMNEVWTNMNVNINRCLLIRPEVYENKNFPIHKYVNYNPSSTVRNNSYRNNMNRLNKTKTHADMDAEVCSANFAAQRPLLSKLYSTARGVALPKHCATTANQISPKTLTEDANNARTSGVIRTSKTNFHDYRITGSTSLEKFDRHGCNQYSFY